MKTVHNDEEYYINIRNYMVQRAYAVKADADSNLLSLAVLSESFYAAFLNILFDIHLRNENAYEQNAKGIDLIDFENHVAVQVSLTCAPDKIRKKIQGSLLKFDKPDDEMWQFYYVPITNQAPELKKGFQVPEGLKFDRAKDVLDISRILSIALDRHKLKELSKLVDQYSKKDSEQQELRNSLDRLLLETWREHRSFKLMHTDDIDRRLFSEIKDGHHFPALGRRKEDDAESPVWSIIRESWMEPKNHPIMIQGKGGIGKTVTLFSLTDLDKSLLPAPAVYVPMFELVDKRRRIINLSTFFQSIEPFSSLPKEQRKGICTLAAQPWEHGPSLLVLLDGFNEVPGNLRWDMLRMLRKWNIANKGAQLIAVSRPMDNLSLENAFGDSTIAITLSELKRESVEKYLKSLDDEGVRLPEQESPAWNTIVYPLFLTLYIKSERLRDQQLWKDYPMVVRDVAGPGSLIWNYLQRELLQQQDEDWILRCAVACEYIAPELAFRLLQKYDYTVSQVEAVSIIRKIVSSMSLEHMPRHLTDVFSCWKSQNLSTELPSFLKEYDWPEIVLRETGLFVPYGKANVGQRYEFFHQSFRDCLAGLHLINQAEIAREDGLPEVWKHGQDHLALDYAAELMYEDTAERLWEINRRTMQYISPSYVNDHSGTLALLEFQKRRKPIPENLDFSGMDLRGVSLTRYIGSGEGKLPIFMNPQCTNSTMFDRSTFQNEGHNALVSCIAVFPDGRVVSGSNDCTLRVWDSTTGQCLQTLKGHSGWVSCVAVLPNEWVVSGSVDCTLRIWDTSTGECLYVLKGHKDRISAIAVLKDGRIISGSGDGSLRVWNSKTGEYMQSLEGHSDIDSCVAFLPNGWVVINSRKFQRKEKKNRDEKISEAEAELEQLLQDASTHPNGITCVMILPDGQVACGSDDGLIWIWNVETSSCQQILEGHLEGISCMSFLENGQVVKVVSCSNDHTIKLWNPVTGQCLQTMKGHSERISCVKVLPDGCIVSGSENGELIVWNSMTGQHLQTMKGHSDLISCVTVFPDGRVISGSADRTLRIWDSKTGRHLQTMTGHSGGISCVEILPGGRVVSSSGDGSLRVWDSVSDQCLQTMAGYSGWIYCVAFLPDGQVVSGSCDGFLRIWDSRTGQCIQTMAGHSDWIYCVTVLENGHMISGSGDGSLRVWNSATGQCIKTMVGESGGIYCTAALPNGQVVSGSGYGLLQIWNPLTGNCLHTLKGHTECIYYVGVLLDGRVISASRDRTIRIWNPETGDCLQIIDKFSTEIAYIAVLPNGRVVSSLSFGSPQVWNSGIRQCRQVMEEYSTGNYCVAILPTGQLLTGSDKGFLQVWDTTTGECIQSLRVHTDWISCVTASQDGRIAVGSRNRTLQIWNLDNRKCMAKMEVMEIDVSRMNLSTAILTEDLAKLLWQNGAKISDVD